MARDCHQQQEEGQWFAEQLLQAHQIPCRCQSPSQDVRRSNICSRPSAEGVEQRHQYGWRANEEEYGIGHLPEQDR
jgi:hypothetical protein